VEVTIFLKESQGYVTYGFQMAGQVVQIKADPSEDNNYFPMANEHDMRGSCFLSGMHGEAVMSQGQAHLLPQGITLKRCECDVPGCKQGELFMTKERYFENKFEAKQKEELYNLMEKGSVVFLGAKHGQRIMCEGRLNYDNDMQRGSDEPPWCVHVFVPLTLTTDHT
jgi:hypothetical protein